MKGTRFISAIGGVLLLCAASQALPAREYHVAKNGSDANPGTVSQFRKPRRYSPPATPSPCTAEHTESG